MPAWVKDHSLWEKAKAQAKKEYSEDDANFYAIVTAIYKKMGGGIQHAAKSVGFTLSFRRRS
jgi:hypothetical protein